MLIQTVLILCVLFAILFNSASMNIGIKKLKGVRRFQAGNYKILLLIIMIYMAFLRTFVEMTSVSDITNYQRALYEANITPFYKLLDVDGEIRIEPGYRLMMKLFTIFSLDINFFLFLHALITQVLLYKIINKYSANPLISVLSYTIVFFCPSLYILRQYLAMIILFTSVDAIVNRNITKFIITLLVAISVHFVAVVFAPIYLLYGIKNNKNLLIALGITALVLFSGFKLLYFYFGSTFFGGYDTYLYTDKYDGSNYTEALIMLCIIVCYLYYSKSAIFKDPIDKFIFISSVVGCILNFSGSGLPLVGRLASYYNFVLIFTLPRTMSYMNKGLMRTLYAVIVCFLLYIAYFNDECINTYKLIF